MNGHYDRKMLWGSPGIAQSYWNIGESYTFGSQAHREWNKSQLYERVCT